MADTQQIKMLADSRGKLFPAKRLDLYCHYTIDLSSNLIVIFRAAYFND